MSQSGQAVWGLPGRRWGSLARSTGPGEGGRPLGCFCELEPGRRGWTGGQEQGVVARWRRVWRREEPGAGASGGRELAPRSAASASPSLGRPGSTFPDWELILGDVRS